MASRYVWDMFQSVTFNVLFLLALAVLVFLILREFATWYWKQSRQVVVLESIERLLQELVAQGRVVPPPTSLPSNGTTPIAPLPAPARTPNRFWAAFDRATDRVLG